MSAHMPQSSIGLPLTKIVDGTAGEVFTRRFPSATKLATTSVVTPLVITIGVVNAWVTVPPGVFVTVTVGGLSNPVTLEKDRV